MIRSVVKKVVESAVRLVVYGDDSGDTPRFPFPSGFSFFWLSYEADDVDLINGNQIELARSIDPESTFITQNTSINQPLYIENDVLTQFNVSNQPTLVDVGGDKALSFNGSNHLNDLPVNNENFKYKFVTSANDVLFSCIVGGDVARLNVSLFNDSIRVIPTTGGNLDFFLDSPVVVGEVLEIELIKTGNTMSCFKSGVQQDTDKDVTGNTYIFDKIGRTGSVNNLNGDLYYFEQYDLDISSTSPIFTIDAQTSIFRKTDGSIAEIGDQIAKAYATQHNKYLNKMKFDGDNDFLGSLPSVATTEASLVLYNWTIEPKGSLQYILKSSSSNATIRINSNNRIVLDDELGTSVSFNYEVDGTEGTIIIDFDATTSNLYVNSYLRDSVDITGLSYAGLYDLGNATSSIDSELTGIGTYPKKLNEDERNYFSYLRDVETNQIQLDENGNPQLPAPPPIVNAFVSDSQGLTEFTITTENDEVATWDFGDGSPLQTTNTPSYTYTDSAPNHNITLTNIDKNKIVGVDASNALISDIDIDQMPNVITIDVSDTNLDGTSIDELLAHLAPLSFADPTFIDYRNAPGELTATNKTDYDTIIANGGTVLGNPPSAITGVNSMGLFNTSDYALATKSTALETESDQTWSMRFKIPLGTTQQYHQIFTLNADAPVGRSSNIYFQTIAPDTIQVEYYNHPTVGSNSGNTSIISPPINNGVWHHLLVSMDVEDTATATMYIDGVVAGTTPINTKVGNDPLLDIGIGSRPPYFGNDIKGYMNNVRIWPRAFTPIEALIEWNNSASEFLCYNNAVSGSSLSVDLTDSSLVDDSGNSTVTAMGTPTYTDQGMTESC